MTEGTRAASPEGTEAGRRPVRRSDVVIGLLLLALSGEVFWASRDIPTPPFVPLTPAFFPRVVAAALALLALLLIVRGLRGVRAAAPPGGVGARAGGKAPLLPAVLVFGALAGYIVLIPVLGFFSSTFLFMVALGWGLEGGRASSLPRGVVVALATTLLVYFVFTGYLRVLFPEGLLR